MRLLYWILNLFTGKGEDNGIINNDDSKIDFSTSEFSRSALFYKLFQNNKLAEYHFERKVFAALSSRGLIQYGSSYFKFIFTKEPSAGIITCQLKVIKEGERKKNIFSVYLNHLSDNTLQIQTFSFSSHCCNLEIEKDVYRYIAIIASEAGYSYIEPSSIVYELKDDFDFSKPDIGDLFPCLGNLRSMSSEDIQKIDSEASEDDFGKFLELAHIEEFNLFNLISYEKTVAISDIILRTNQNLSEIQKNYLIKMARTLYCDYNSCEDNRDTFRKECVLLSQIVFFLATDKLNIPVTNINILDGCMEGMGAHIVTEINGRIVDATSDQFQPDGRGLNPYDDNSFYFNYSMVSA